MFTRSRFLVALFVLSLASTSHAATPRFEEGRHYSVLASPQPTRVAPGKVEVTEVFSYGCPGCYQFESTMVRLRSALPANAQLNVVHAAWNKAESWPMFQRAFATAQVLGIAEQSHAAMFEAVWGRGGALAVVDSQTGRLKARQPTIQDVARFHASRGVCTEAQFLKAAQSFAVETRVRQSEALVRGYQVPQTPCLIVDGRYRVEFAGISSPEQLFALVQFLVRKAA